MSGKRPSVPEQETLTLATARGRHAPEVPAPPVEDPGPEPGRVSLQTIAALPLRDRGRYERLGELARGGLGRIVVAYNRELGRDVALKELLRREAEAEARFVREARITAALEHPGVVPIYDAGRWDDDLAPFYEMKRVRGRSLEERITACRSRGERLALLSHVLAVAETIGYAHARGVIHRDLKPANVIVGDFGETVVIDWGLAKEIGASETRAAGRARAPGTEGELTVAGQVVGTPAYMPPEQARGEDVDARADVYAIGAMLYHVLSGARPYAGSGTGELLERVRREAPSPLAQHAPGLRAELTSIVDKAMARDPAARYASVQELVQELRRYESGQLVRAHAYTRWERVRRLLRRRRARIGYLAAAVVVLLAVLGIAMSERLAGVSVVCGIDEAELAGVWDDNVRRDVAAALERRGQADAIPAVARVFDAHRTAWLSMKRDSCEATHVRGQQSMQLLDLRSECLRRKRVALREYVAVLLEGIPASSDVGPLEFANAIPDMTSCADTDVLLGAPPVPREEPMKSRWAALEVDLARLNASLNAGVQGLAPEVERLLAEARAVGSLMDEAQALDLQSRVFLQLDRMTDAAASLAAAVATADRVGDDRRRAYALLELIYVVQGVLRDRRRALELLALAPGVIARAGSRPDMLASYHVRKAEREMDDDRLQRALLHARKAVDVGRRGGGIEEAIALNTLATVLRRLDRMEEALEVSTRHFARLRELFGGAHPDIELAHDGRAQALRALYRFAEAESEYRSALAIRSRSGQSYRVADLNHNLSNVLRQQGKNEEALAAAQRALSLRERLYPEGHRRIGFSHRVVALCYRALGRHDQALGSIERALAMTEPVFGDAHPRFVRELYWKGRILADLGRHEDATRALSRAASADPEDATIAAALARSLAAVGRVPAARKALARAVALATDPDDYEELAMVRMAEAETARAAGDAARARSAAAAALAELDRSPSPMPNERAEIEAWLAGWRVGGGRGTR